MKKEEKVKTIVPSKLAPEVLDGEEEAQAKSLKKEKRKKAFGEFKAFLIIIIILGLVILGGWYWYTHIYKDNTKGSEQTTEKISDYNIISYDTSSNSHELSILDNKYLYEHYENKIFKIMDMETNVLYEGETEYTDIYLGTDDKIYIILNEIGENESVVYLYTLENSALTEVTNFTDQGISYHNILYKESDDESKLLGFTGYKTSINENNEDEITTYIRLLDGSVTELTTGTILYGDEATSSQATDIYTNNSKYIVTSKVDDNANRTYGLYDLENKKEIISSDTYSELVSLNSTSFVATKNNKTGIIDSTQKIIVDYNYDFIAPYEDFYIVCQNDKLALMDSNYKLITDFTYTYNKRLDEANEYYYRLTEEQYNTVVAYHLNDKYLLINSNYLTPDTGTTNTAYIISSDGTSTEVTYYRYQYDETNNYIYFIDETNKQYTVYDNNLNKLYTLDMSNYDLGDTYANIAIEGNSIVMYKVVESVREDITYFKLEDGTETKETPIYTKEVGDSKLTYNYNKKKLTITIASEENKSYDITDFDSEYLVELNETDYYYISNNLYLLVKKNA